MVISIEDVQKIKKFTKDVNDKIINKLQEEKENIKAQLHKFQEFWHNIMGHFHKRIQKSEQKNCSDFCFSLLLKVKRLMIFQWKQLFKLFFCNSYRRF